MSENIKTVCPACRKPNRIPGARLADGPKCGACHQALFTGKPMVLDGDSLRDHIQRDDIPLLVDFWAPWCGPCKVMAPVFEEAARQLEPGLRFGKINTDEYPNASAPYNIRSIPTLILFRNGREAERISGALSLPQLTSWIGQHT